MCGGEYIDWNPRLRCEKCGRKTVNIYYPGVLKCDHCDVFHIPSGFMGYYTPSKVK